MTGATEREAFDITTREGPRRSARSSAPLSQSGVRTLVMGDIIGEGGMGTVRAAVQVSLGRPVAVKTGHAYAEPSEAARMVQEARVTGFLEHPGIVPIYDIARDDDGGPAVVMRRIEGDTWHARMRDAEWASARGARDLVEQNLRVLARVCEIVEFAHAKGVIHRDIKPSNVMIGAFGEVYLLDWGLALALRGAAERHLPRTSTTRELAGTFAYAAPEMVGLIDAPLSEQTDVYLLGAVLFEIASGRRPHARTDAAPPMESIDASPPPVPDQVSPRLAAIITRAMARSPHDRYTCVAQLRLDVLAYLRARDSEHLAARAHDKLVLLRRACGESAPPQTIHELYAEARFGFREAQRTCPENEAATRGLAEASTLVLERALEQDPLRAAALLEGADGVCPEFEARVRSAARAREEEHASLARMTRDNDATVGHRARRGIFVAFGLTWAATLPFAERIGPVTNTRFALGAILQLAFLALAVVVFSDLRRHRYNRRFVAAVAVNFAAQAVLFAVSDALGMDVEAARTLRLGVTALGAAQLTITVERRFWR